jgi:RNA polymerase sigma-70 factor (ECF subfamily)
MAEGRRRGNGSRKPLWAIETRWDNVTRLLSKDVAEREGAWREFHAVYRGAMAAYVRSFLGRALGRDPGEELAEEVTQGFVAESFERGWMGKADRQRGRFRSYLKTILHHYCCNWLEYERAQRRRPPAGTKLLDLDALARHGWEPPVEADEAWRAFDQAWVKTVLDRALDACRRDKPKHAEVIAAYLDALYRPAGTPAPALSATERAQRRRALQHFRGHVVAALAETVRSSLFLEEEWSALAPFLPPGVRSDDDDA